MNTKRIGTGLIVGAIFLWLIDRTTSVISMFFARLYCGKGYMQPANGIVGDGSCGFNADMYLTLFLFTILLAGVFFLLPLKKTPLKNES